MAITRKTKESLKTALAMTIAYGIALYMDWDRPYWAGFAVAMVSLATVGQSLNKAALRILGTVVAIIVAFVLIALFAQQRWMFILFLSIWLGFCTYMMAGPRHAYFWHVSGFVCAIVAIDAGPDAVNAFTIAVLRAQETALGILVYSLVSIFLWPTSSGSQLGVAVVKLASTQRSLAGAYLERLLGKTDTGDAQSQRAAEVAARSSFDLLLASAVTDDVGIREQRSQWREYQRLATSLSNTLDCLRECFTEVQSLDLRDLLPDLSEYGAELESRLKQVEDLLADQTTHQSPVSVELPFDRSRIHSLSHFEKAAMVVTRAQLEQLEKVTRGLVACVRSIKGLDPVVTTDDELDEPETIFTLDRDRGTAAIRAIVTVFLAWLALIYVSDLPNGTTFVMMSAPIGMALATMPQLRVSQLFMPATIGVLIGGVAHVFVMPHLSGFVGLGLMLFGVTFTVCYVFAAPQQMLGRALGLALFVTIAGIDNDQSYSILNVINTALVFAMVFSLFSITAYIPVSPSPEKAFLRLLGRFFRSCDYLATLMGRDSNQPSTRLERWRKIFHASEVSALPGKLEVWVKFIDPTAMPGTSTKQVQALVASLRTMTRCIQELLEERTHTQSKILVEALTGDIREWRLAVHSVLRQLSQNPAAADPEVLRNALAETMGHLEKRIIETLDKAPRGQISERDGEKFYRLLGSYRGVSAALVDYAGSASTIEWDHWYTERFA
jgi:uncharacterized membrane protein YccC